MISMPLMCRNLTSLGVSDAAIDGPNTNFIDHNGIRVEMVVQLLVCIRRRLFSSVAGHVVRRVLEAERIHDPLRPCAQTDDARKPQRDFAPFVNQIAIPSLHSGWVSSAAENNAQNFPTLQLWVGRRRQISACEGLSPSCHDNEETVGSHPLSLRSYTDIRDNEVIAWTFSRIGECRRAVFLPLCRNQRKDWDMSQRNRSIFGLSGGCSQCSQR